LHCTGNDGRFGEKDEGDQETKEYSSQENERQFSTRSLHDWSIEVFDECMDNKESQQDSKKRCGNWNYCINGIPSHVLLRKLITTRLVDVRPPSV
jgi:hypothetical protein